MRAALGLLCVFGGLSLALYTLSGRVPFSGTSTLGGNAPTLGTYGGPMIRNGGAS